MDFNCWFSRKHCNQCQFVLVLSDGCLRPHAAVCQVTLFLWSIFQPLTRWCDNYSREICYSNRGKKQNSNEQTDGHMQSNELIWTDLSRKNRTENDFYHFFPEATTHFSDAIMIQWYFWYNLLFFLVILACKFGCVCWCSCFKKSPYSNDSWSIYWSKRR